MIIDHPRDLKEFKDFYIKHPMNDGIFSYDFILNNPNLYCFYGEDDNKLKGYIFIYTDETRKLYLAGASIRKNMTDNIKAIIKVCNSFDNDIYSDTDKKEAAICLLKAGFKKIKDNKYVRYKNG